MRRADDRRAVAAEVAIAEVVAENDDDVWFRRSEYRRQSYGEGDEEREEFHAWMLE
jgi:hypothetical protein